MACTYSFVDQDGKNKTLDANEFKAWLANGGLEFARAFKSDMTKPVASAPGAKADAPYSEMSYDELERAYDEAIKFNDAMDMAAVRKYAPEMVEKFASMSRRKRDAWMEDNATEEMDREIAAFNGINEDDIRAYMSAVNDFATESPEALGASVALKTRGADNPDYIGSPDYTTVRNALRYAKEQGWSEKDVIAGMRARASSWAGADAPELFARLFKQATAPRQPKDITPNAPLQELNAPPKFSRSPTTQNTHSVSTLTEELSKAFKPAFVKALLANKKFSIITMDDAKKILGDSDSFSQDNGAAQAFYQDGKTYLIADAISKDATPTELNGLLKHEIGVHAMHLGVNDAEFKSILSDMDAMRKSGDKYVIAAYDRAKQAGTKTGDVAHETLAYLVQNAPESPLSARVMAFIKRMINKALGVANLHWKYTSAELNEMASVALRDFVDSERMVAENQGAMLSKSASPLTAEEQSFADTERANNGAQLEQPAYTGNAEIDSGINFVYEIESLSEKYGSVFIRWSPSSEADLSGARTSRDFNSGEVHAGLSAVEITDDMHPVDIAKRLSEYGFLRLQDRRSTPRVYLADRVGTDSDGYASIKPKELLLDSRPDVLSAIDLKLAEVMGALDDIKRESKKLEQHPAHPAIKARLEAAKQILAKLLPNYQPTGSIQTQPQSFAATEQAYGGREAFDKARADGTNPDIRFSFAGERAQTEDKYALATAPSQTSQAIKVARIQSIADDLAKTWKNAPKIVSVANMEDTAIPEIARQVDADMRKKGAKGNPKGFFYEGTVYVIASEHNSIKDVITTVAHETLGHAGLRGVFGDSLNKVLNQIVLARRSEIIAKAREYGLHNNSITERSTKAEVWAAMSEKNKQVAAEEVLASMAEKQPDTSVVKQAIAAIRQWLRNIGMSIELSNDDIIANFIIPARRYIEGGSKMPVQVSERVEPYFSRASAIEHYGDINDEQAGLLSKIGKPSVATSLKQRYAQFTEKLGLKIAQGLVDKYRPLYELDKAVHGENVKTESTAMSSWILSRMAEAGGSALTAMLTGGRIAYDNANKIIIPQSETPDGGLLGVLTQLGSAKEIDRFLGWIAANRSLQIKQKSEAAQADVARIKAEIDNLRDMLRDTTISPQERATIGKAINDGDVALKAAKAKADVTERLFTDNEIRAGIELNKGTNAAGGDREAIFRKVYSEFKVYQSDVLKIASDTGLISKEWIDAWKNDFYVPFYRVLEDESITGSRPGGSLRPQEAFKKLKGGTQNVNDLLENTLLNFNHLLSNGLKNVATKQAIDNAILAGIATKVSQQDAGKQAVHVFVDGKKEFYDIEDAMIFNSMVMLIHSGIKGAAMDAMRSFKRVFTSLTTKTPQFIVANGIRDSLQVIAVANMDYNVAKNVTKGAELYGIGSKMTPTRMAMLASGGAFSFGQIYGRGADDIRHGLNNTVASVIRTPQDAQNMIKNAGNQIASLWDKWSSLSDSIENVNRAALYDKNKANPLLAAFESRDLMDFSAHGAWPAVRFLTDVVPFLNARLQGLDKLYRSGFKPTYNVIAAMMSNNPSSITDKQAAIRFSAVVGALSLATMALFMGNYDDDEYKKLEDWQKDTYWVFRVGNNMFFIPKPFEVGAMATLAERTLEQMVDDKATGKLFAERLKFMFGQTFSFNPVPQMFTPLLDVYSNYDGFTKRPIESAGMERLSPSLRTRTNTSGTAKAASATLESVMGQAAPSPVQIDHLINGYLSWLGSFITGSADAVINAANGKETPSKEWFEHQPAKRFYRNLDVPTYTKYQTQFYEYLRESNRIHADINNLRELGRMEDADDMMNKYRDKLDARKPLNRAQAKLTKINNQMKIIMRSNMSGDAKRNRLNELTTQKNDITERMAASYPIR